jgi:DNA-binding transcriptional ArsR family regulator
MTTAQTRVNIEQIKILADGQRLAILRRLMAHVRHHVKVLEQAGLVPLDPTHAVRGFTEKRYRATARAYRIHLPSCLNHGEAAAPGRPRASGMER